MDKIKILIADDNNEIRDYFGGIISHEPDMELMGSVSSGIDAVSFALENKPDIVLMDIQMETRTAGIDAAKRILAEDNNIKIVILTILEDDDLLFQAYCAGVMDYIIKTDSITQVLSSIRNVYKNRLILRPQYAEKIIEELSHVKEQQKSLFMFMNILTKLSNSEFEILKSLYTGMTYKQISELRYVSTVTIKSQVHSILKKFNMKNIKEVLKELRVVGFEQFIDQNGR
ncbi:response regulator transcription factor [Butyrivibrio sp. INlla21]|uniref:response regulator transcription factor n=1 Tax=Butyrivibrio sp. INlla21 TaxID=1520811 RepID=UPI0008F15ADE|nr:response regulator transcription factor [Butyrivibrio sp. INlla21]SFU90306.1 DNA-binding response regulator, NarL/FixJ family, contains REC and HTH domains [Butyrivibrio sp. INlla21]